jgi:hypothetical protein
MWRPYVDDAEIYLAHSFKVTQPLDVGQHNNLLTLVRNKILDHK